MAQVRVFVGDKSLGTRFKTRRCIQIMFWMNIEKLKNCKICELLKYLAPGRYLVISLLRANISSLILINLRL